MNNFETEIERFKTLSNVCKESLAKFQSDTFQCLTCPAKMFCRLYTKGDNKAGCQEVLLKWYEFGKCFDCFYFSENGNTGLCNFYTFITGKDSSCPNWKPKDQNVLDTTAKENTVVDSGKVFIKYEKEKDKLRILDAWTINIAHVESIDKNNTVTLFRYITEEAIYEISYKDALAKGEYHTFKGEYKLCVPVRFWEKSRLKNSIGEVK